MQRKIASGEEGPPIFIPFEQSRFAQQRSHSTSDRQQRGILNTTAFCVYLVLFPVCRALVYKFLLLSISLSIQRCQEFSI